MAALAAEPSAASAEYRSDGLPGAASPPLSQPEQPAKEGIAAEQSGVGHLEPPGGPHSAVVPTPSPAPKLLASLRLPVAHKFLCTVLQEAAACDQRRAGTITGA